MRIKITSDGSGCGTKVTIDGYEIPHVERIAFVHRARQSPRVVICIAVSDVEIEADNPELQALTRVIETS